MGAIYRLRLLRTNREQQTPPPEFKTERPKLRNIILALRDQGPFTRFLRNLWRGHVLGLFHLRSHYRDDGNAKVMYKSKESATRAAESMFKKKGVWFSNYKCIYCDGYHVGKNRDNKLVTKG